MIRTLAAAVLALGFTAAAQAEVTVKIEKTHMCCGSCEKGAVKAAAGVKDATVTASKPDKNIVIVAKDEKAAQAAVDALAKGGYHGKIEGSKSVKIADDSGAKPGKKQQSVVVSGFHNCCKSCSTPINKAIAASGATGEVQSKETQVTVSGNFDAAELVKKLNDAGYHVKVEAK